MNAVIDIERLGDEIAELSAHIHAATYRLLTLIRRFDEGGGWNNGSTRSCAHWLSYRTGHSIHAAREMVRVARALAKLPLISDAMRKGEISYSKVRAMTRVATPENEHKLLQIAHGGTASHVERIAGAWRRLDLAEEKSEADRQQANRYLTAYTDDDGMLVLRGRLTPEVGAAVLKALESVTKLPHSDVPAGTLTPTQRRADALGLVAERALQKGLEEGSTSDRYQVVVHVDEQVLEDPTRSGQSVLEDGPRVSVETSRRIACDSSKVVMQHGTDGTVLDVGRKTRTVPSPLRRALTHRDRYCRFPGCESKFCDAHHIEHWANGGETKLSNLLLLCRLHHRAVHEEGYQVEFLPDGETEFYNPYGVKIPRVPEAPALPEDPVLALMDRHREESLTMDAETTRPNWDGLPVDVGYVIDVLRSP